MGIAKECQLPVFQGFTFKIFMIVKGVNDRNPRFEVLQFENPDDENEEGEQIAIYENGEYHNSGKMEFIPARIKTKIESSIEKLNNGGYENVLESFFNVHKVEENRVAELTK